MKAYFQPELKLLKNITPNINEINDAFITKGKDIQEELKISIEDGTPLKTVIAHINSFTQKATENINLIEDYQNKKIPEKINQLKRDISKATKISYYREHRSDFYFIDA